jgi:transcriptional regulator with XRE-family HTH domain
MAKETNNKKELARALYMSGATQEEIADKVGVARVSISRWANAEGWKEVRAARSITRPELVNKLLVTIDKLIEQASQEDSDASGLADKLAKFASVIQKLDKKANVVDAIEVFMAFNKWLEFRAADDPEITVELRKAINKYQDRFLLENMGKSSLE